MATSPAADKPEDALPGSGEVASPPAPDVVARSAGFAELTSTANAPAASSLHSLMDVTVTLSAELGRITMSIADILKLNTGSVVELDRLVSEPVDLMVKGVRLARGEVVVVDDHFAIRIKEIAEPKKGA